MSKRVLGVAAALALLCSQPALAHAHVGNPALSPSCPKQLRGSYGYAWRQVNDRAKRGIYRREAAGRNIQRWGVITKHHALRPATCTELRVSKAQLHEILHPRPYLVNHTSPPAQTPAGVQTAYAAPTGLASCIVSRESGGNPQASNGTHFGIGQWDLPTWRAHGGTRYAPTPLGATYQEQLIVLSGALRRYGCSAWCRYDGC